MAQLAQSHTITVLAESDCRTVTTRICFVSKGAEHTPQTLPMYRGVRSHVERTFGLARSLFHMPRAVWNTRQNGNALYPPVV